jgi:plasmid stabilization system protein ParE
MEYRFRLTGRAIADIQIIYDRIAANSPRLADKWHRKIFNRFDTLRRFPLSCPRAPEAEKFGEEIRELIMGKRQSTYRILFVVREDVAIIIAVWHASRGPAEL